MTIRTFLLDNGNGNGEFSLEGKVVFSSIDEAPARASMDMILDDSNKRWHLRQDIHDWLEVLNIPYGIRWAEWPGEFLPLGFSRGWLIDLDCEDKYILLFKLTWL